jgi:nucleoside-diphosphate-sugar epimerase
MTRCLVTGCAGFIGRSLVSVLLARGEYVRGVDNFSTGKYSNLRDLTDMDLIDGDLGDPNVCARACSDIDVIFHEAALPSVPRSVEEPVSTHFHCVTATLNLLIAAKDANVKRVIYAGSSSAYGDVPTLPKHEKMIPNPISPYAAAKLAGEFYMQSFSRTYGIETVILRYFNVFGPYQDPGSPYSGVLAAFCRRLLAGECVTIDGDGEQSRDFTYIDNVVNANLLAAETPGEKVSGRTMNIATGSRITVTQAFEILRELTGYRGSPTFGPPRAGDVRHSVADIRLAKDLIGYQPTVDFQEGLRRTVKWYREAS